MCWMNCDWSKISEERKTKENDEKLEDVPVQIC